MFCLNSLSNWGPECGWCMFWSVSANVFALSVWFVVVEPSCFFSGLDVRD